MKSANIHPMGKKARVLLTSVFGPYANDDEFGSRKINPMELYQNQVTRVQGVFSLRMFHRSFGLCLIQENLEAPCTLLDFPVLQRFIQEIQEQTYDVIGISAIIPNILKVKKMCELIRHYQPHASIVVGGHIANKTDIESWIDADHIVKGDGVRWFRQYLGQNPDEPIKHPAVESAHGVRILGQNIQSKPGNIAAILIPSVGCPVGCNFCCTSALFGGKGHFVNFYETGEELFKVMCDLEQKLKTRSFFILDENFLLHKKRALELLELMKKHNKAWALRVFSSARVLKSYKMEDLIRLGVSWVWMGLEGKSSEYSKLNGVDTIELVKTLQENGIRVLGSSIIGLENHTPENIDEAIDYAVSHNTDFHQFMLYTPSSGTPLYEEYKKKGLLIDEKEFPVWDTHGQYRFNYRHPNIKENQEEQFLLDAFTRDFEVNGPSLFRLTKTQLAGWKKYKNSADPQVRERFEWETEALKKEYAGALWAMRRYYHRRDDKIYKEMTELLHDLYREFGWKTRIAAPLIGAFLYMKLKQEEKRLETDWTYEPKQFYEKNPASLALENIKEQVQDHETESNNMHTMLKLDKA